LFSINKEKTINPEVESKLHSSIEEYISILKQK
jgi:hypothetical protein